MQVAAQAGAVSVLTYLKGECGVEVGEGGTLHCAAREGQTDMVQRLISWGVEVDNRLVVVLDMFDMCLVCLVQGWQRKNTLVPEC